MKCWAVFILIFNSTVIYAQDVVLNSFNGGSDGKQVKLSWIIAQGNTCNGMAVLRSADSINFEEIGIINGICGSSTAPVGYDYSDTKPIANKASYYRLRLGPSQLTSIIRMLHINHSTPYLVFPNPSCGNVNIIIADADVSKYTVQLYNMAGIRMSTDTIASKSYILKRGNIPSGIYVYTIKNDAGKQAQGLLLFSDK
jgi:hypothetical protein